MFRSQGEVELALVRLGGFFFLFKSVYFLATLLGMWILSSPTRG